MKIIKILAILCLSILSGYFLEDFIRAEWDIHNWYEVTFALFVIFLPIGGSLLLLAFFSYKKMLGVYKYIALAGIVIGLIDVAVPLFLLVRNLFY
jgi:hypothetical protein